MSKILPGLDDIPTWEEVANQFAIEQRRNPPSKAMQRLMKIEGKNFEFKQYPDQVYALAVGPEDEPVIFYIGISIHPARRFADHLKGVSDPKNMKRAYRWVRKRPDADTLRMIILDPTGEFTEEEWRAEYEKLGYPLQNGVAGVDVKRKHLISDSESTESHIFDRAKQIIKDRKASQK